jgi:hypothetical protein
MREISSDWWANVKNAFFTRNSVVDLLAPIITSLPSRKRTVMLHTLVGPEPNSEKIKGIIAS